jgi:hypothetical protein
MFFVFSINKMEPLMIVKIILLVYILLSPLLDHRYVLFINDTPIKVLMLIAIILVSFIDLPLAILLTVVFLVMLINVYRMDVVSMKKKWHANQEMHVLAESIVAQESKSQEFPVVIAEESRSDFATEQKEQNKKFTISNFPEPYCPVVDKSTDISKHMYDITIDDRIKPYEEYVRKLSPEHALMSAQDNTVIFSQIGDR